MYHPWSIHSSVDGHLRGFYLLAVRINAAVDMVFRSLGHIPGNRVARV